MRRKFPLVRSADQSDCGPAALASVSRYYGLAISAGAIAEMVSGDLQGTTLSELKRCAEELGFRATAGRIREQALARLPLPAIVHFDDTPTGHFAVLCEVRDERVLLADPARGVSWRSVAEFRERWSGRGLLLEPAGTLKAVEVGPTALRYLLALGSRERGLLLAAAACGLGASGLAFVVSLYLKWVVDSILPARDWAALHALSLGVAVCLFTQAYYLNARQAILALAGFRVELSESRRYLSHLLGLPLPAIERRCTGDLVMRLSDVDAMSRAITGVFLSIAIDAVFFCSALAIVLVHEAWLAALVVVAVGVAGGISFLMQTPMSDLQRTIREETSGLFNGVVESVIAMKVIKTFSAEGSVSKELFTRLGRLKEAALRRNMLAARVAATGSAIGGYSWLGVVWLGASAVGTGNLTLGQLVFVLSILGYVLGPVDRLGASWATLQEAIVGAERLNAIMAIPVEQDAADCSRIERIRSVEMRGVSFEFRRSSPVLSDVSLAIRPGQPTFLIGSTGSGKTSIASILLGLYEPTSGEVLVNGVGLREVEKASFRSLVGAVFQDAALMNGSILDNLRLSAPAAELSDIEDAVRLAGADEFIGSLPRQYSYQVGDGGKALSGGQRQRIAIARALLRRPELLVLDEATSNLDTHMERRVMEGILAARRDLCTVVITHRVGSIPPGARVLEVVAGRVKERSAVCLRSVGGQGGGE